VSQRGGKKRKGKSTVIPFFCAVSESDAASGAEEKEREGKRKKGQSSRGKEGREKKGRERGKYAFSFSQVVKRGRREGRAGSHRLWEKKMVRKKRRLPFPPSNSPLSSRREKGERRGKRRRGETQRNLNSRRGNESARTLVYTFSSNFRIGGKGGKRGKRKLRPSQKREEKVRRGAVYNASRSVLIAYRRRGKGEKGKKECANPTPSKLYKRGEK